MHKRLKIKKGDMVVVIAGDHKGQKGRVIAV
ncbi:MAG: KOW motif-containing protein, partial [Bacteroidota bacterium]